MKFEMNGRTYKIKETSQNDMQKEQGETDGIYFGLTIPSKQEIWVLEDLKEEQKRKTLYHELMHCYIFNYIGFSEMNFSGECWADVSANSHDIIHKIVEDYFNKKK